MVSPFKNLSVTLNICSEYSLKFIYQIFIEHILCLRLCARPELKIPEGIWFTNKTFFLIAVTNIMLYAIKKIYRYCNENWENQEIFI